MIRLTALSRRHSLAFGCHCWLVQQCQRAVCMSAIAFCLLANFAAAQAPVSDDVSPRATAAQASLVIVVGAPGNDEYGSHFTRWADLWAEAAQAGGVPVQWVGTDETDPNDRERLHGILQEAASQSEGPLWLVMIGHGTWDGRDARFNLRGLDVSDRELQAWLAPLTRPLAVINCASSSSPYLLRLSQPGRIVITATKSGSELNFSRFGGFLAEAIGNPEADLDKDHQVSLFEAFLIASRQTQAWYDANGQLATEHALLDDNGDAQGVRADFFTGIRPAHAAEGGVPLDGARAHQWLLVPADEERHFPAELRPRRDELELLVAQLRDRKSSFDEETYFAQLEVLLVELAQLYQQADELSEADHVTPAAPDTHSAETDAPASTTDRVTDPADAARPPRPPAPPESLMR